MKKLTIIKRTYKPDEGFITPFYTDTDDKRLFWVTVVREYSFLHIFKYKKICRLPFAFDDIEIARQFLSNISSIGHIIMGYFIYDNKLTYRYLANLITDKFSMLVCFMFINGKRVQLNFNSDYVCTWYDKSRNMYTLDYTTAVFKSMSTDYEIDFENFGAFTKNILKCKNNAKNFYNLKDFITFTS